MNNKLTLVAVAFVLGFVGGYFAFHGSALFGAANVTPSNALDQQALVNELNLIANPLVAIEQSSTAALTFPAVVSSTGYQTSTAIGLAASQGDLVFVSPSTSTPGIVYTGYVVTASTTNATLGISTQNASSATITPSVTTFTVTVLPASGFKAPTGL